MKVSGFTNLMQVNNSNRKANNSGKYSNLAPLKKDTVSFCAKLNETDKSDELTPEEIKRIVTQSGDRRVDDADIEALSLIVDKDKMPLLEKIASMKDNDGLRFSGKNIVSLMSSVNKKNESLFDELANLRYSNGTNRLNGADIANLLFIINEDNKPLFEELIGMKDDKGRYLLGGHSAARIFPVIINEARLQRCEKLLRNGHLVCDELIYNLRHGCGSCWPF